MFMFPFARVLRFCTDCTKKKTEFLLCILIFLLGADYALKNEQVMFYSLKIIMPCMLPISVKHLFGQMFTITSNSHVYLIGSFTWWVVLRQEFQKRNRKETKVW